MSYRSLILAMTGAFGLLAGCTDAPFIDYGTSPTVSKPVDRIKESGHVTICSSRDTAEADVHALAMEACGKYGLQPILEDVSYLSCRLTASRSSSFLCADPSMRDEEGSFVNPFRPGDVAAWERRTGRKAPPLTGAESRVQEAARQLNDTVHPVVLPPDPAPSAAAPSPTSQTTPPPNPPASAQPLSAPPSSMGDIQQFTLPVGSWGDHF